MKIRFLFALLAFAGIVFCIGVARDWRSHPCVGDPVPERIPSLGLRVAELEVVARATLGHASNGVTRARLGPFDIVEEWEEQTHPSHPESVIGHSVHRMLRPAEGVRGGWSQTLYRGPANPSYGQGAALELRRDASGDALLVVAFERDMDMSEAANVVELGPGAPGAKSAYSFRVLRHAGGHPAPRARGLTAVACLLLALAAWLTTLATRRAGLLALRAGVIGADGLVVPEDGSGAVDASAFGVPPGRAVLFDAPAQEAGYRVSASSAKASRVIATTKEVVTNEVKRLVWAAAAVAIASTLVAAAVVIVAA